jgi:hypothetical protein
VLEKTTEVVSHPVDVRVLHIPHRNFRTYADSEKKGNGKKKTYNVSESSSGQVTDVARQMLLLEPSFQARDVGFLQAGKKFSDVLHQGRKSASPLDSSLLRNIESAAIRSWMRDR